MRMRKKPNLGPRLARCAELLIGEPEALRGNWRSLYPEAAQLRLEAGCGKGKFTVETAAANPDILLIAMERVQEALVMAAERALEAGVKNLFFISGDVEHLTDYFAPGEIDLLYINFCDPWPSNKHAKRRLTAPGFLEKYREVLKKGGGIHFKTDNADLFSYSLAQFAACGLTVREVSRDLHADGAVGIMTGYEEKFYALGVPINRCEAYFEKD